MRTQVPTFVVAGAARAGTTAVIESLRHHPDVFVSQPKEPHYLAFAGSAPAFTGPGDDATINRVSVTDLDAYLRLFPSAGEHQVVGEGSVSTLYYHEEAIPRLRDLNSDVRVVIILREPVARAYSSHQYLRNRGFEPLPDFLDAVDAEPVRASNGWHHLWHYTSMSMYADAVEAFVSELGTEQVGVWWYDHLRDNPATCLESIHSFVGVPQSAVAGPAVGKVNASGRPRRPWLQAAIHEASRHDRLRSALKQVVPFGLREHIRNSNLRPGEIPYAARNVLADRFAADLDKLERILGRPVPEGWRL